VIQAYAITPGSFNDVIELLLPELKRRGLFWDDYVVDRGTYRENLYGKEGQSALPSDHPAHDYRWRAGTYFPINFRYIFMHSPILRILMRSRCHGP
jgi:hypothetical protein